MLLLWSHPVTVGGEDIERAHAGDRAATRALFDYLWAVIERAVMRRLRPVARARGRDPLTERDDLVAEVLKHLISNDWRVLRGFDAARGSLEGYISTIADRQVFAVFRVKSRDPFGEIPMNDDELDAQSDPEVGHEQQIWARAELDELYQFLCARLDDRGVMLFWMLEVDELPVTDIAQSTQMSRDAIYQWRARFRRLAREWRENQR
jgi:RNA polymerase sigma factor (sigma-70 family)